MSNKRAAKRRIKRLARTPHHVWIKRSKNKQALQRRLARLEELAQA